MAQIVYQTQDVFDLKNEQGAWKESILLQARS